MKVDKNVSEKWFKKKHKDIIESCWISDDMKCAYKNLLCAAYESGIKDAQKIYKKREIHE